MVQRGGVDGALCVIARSTSVAMRLAAGRGGRRLFLSYGLPVPQGGSGKLAQALSAVV